MKTVHVKSVAIGPAAPLAIIAGPCVAESYDLCMTIGTRLRDRCQKLGFGYVFKGSFDKANRSSIGSSRGLGIEEGLKVLERVGRELGVPTTTDIHETHHAGPAAQAVDLLQIPAFLCRQTDLLVAAALTGRPVNVKKGQFLSPQEMSNVVTKLEEGFKLAREKGVDVSRSGIVLTERGTFFGYNRLVNDFAGVADMMELGWPVCFDATHSTQKPGEGKQSGGRPERAPMLARCAVAAGVQAVFIEAHPTPKQSLSDAATILDLDVAAALLDDLAKIRRALA